MDENSFKSAGSGNSFTVADLKVACILVWGKMLDWIYQFSQKCSMA